MKIFTSSRCSRKRTESLKQLCSHSLSGLFLLSLLFLAPKAVRAEESYLYSLYYQGMPGGRAVLMRNVDDSTAVLELILQTNMILDRFFRIRDTIRVEADPETYVLQSLSRHINEGKYHKTSLLKMDSAGRDTASIRDEYCALLMLMDPAWFRARSLDLNLLIKKKEQPFVIEEKHREYLTVNGRTRQVILYVPNEESLRNVGRDNASLSIWMLNEQPSYPLQIKLEFQYGTVLLKYRDRIK